MESLRTTRLRRGRWWIPLVLGLVCVAFGVVVLAAPLDSVDALATLVGAGLVITAVIELLTAPTSPRPALARLTGGLWLVVGGVALLWPGLTPRGLAIVVGIGLVVGGVAKVVSALGGEGDERLVLALSGITSVLLGLAALTWPTVTVLVIAVIFGVRMLLFGFGQLALALRVRASAAGLSLEEGLGHRAAWPGWLRLTGGLVALALAAGALAVTVAVRRAQPRQPGAFYTAPDPLPGPPGTLIRSEVIDPFRQGGTAHRILYVTTDHDGRPTTSSGIVVVPDTPVPPGGRTVVAWAHGTIGIARNCSPSLIDGPTYAPLIRGIDELLAAGHVIAASDYPGMGSGGPTAYLVGEAQAVAVLDSVRAARQLPTAEAGPDFGVWGESQGGQASLFTGEYAAAYAPDLRLVGVAAAAPASELTQLFEVNVGTTFGNVLAAYAMDSWERIYGDLDLESILVPEAIPVVRRIAKLCIGSTGQTLAVLPEAELLKLRFLKVPPWEVEPWATILDENSAGRLRTGVPILIAQGADDPLVRPAVQQDFVDRLCAAGEAVDLRTYPGVGHLDAGEASAADVVAWLGARFADEPAASTC